MYLIKVPLFIALFLIGCGSPYVYKNGYKVEKEVDTSDITIESIQKSPDIQKKIIVVDSIIDARVAKEIAVKLRYLDGKVKVINLYLTTEGGWLTDAFKVVDSIKSIQTPVNIYVKDYCKSAGVVILLGATGKRFAYKDSFIILHFNRDYDSNNSLSQINTQRFENIYKTRSNIPLSWYPLSGDRIIKLNALEAKKYSIIDEIL